VAIGERLRYVSEFEDNARILNILVQRHGREQFLRKLQEDKLRRGQLEQQEKRSSSSTLNDYPSRSSRDDDALSDDVVNKQY
jgi:hypothetical protein